MNFMFYTAAVCRFRIRLETSAALKAIPSRHQRLSASSLSLLGDKVKVVGEVPNVELPGERHVFVYEQVRAYWKSSQKVAD
ncbi:MAG: hypothetical protein L0229_07050 [Blastocatellia bacterium]|nr:hypothetical protein [Blastocatellia bacterium]